MISSKIYSEIQGLLLLVVCLTIINLSIGDQKICGHNLREVLELECPQGFNGYKTKRSSLSFDEDFSNENTEEDFNFGLTLDLLPLLTSMDNNGGIAKFRRRTHGIVHECCDKLCNTQEIQSYCLRVPKVG